MDEHSNGFHIHAHRVQFTPCGACRDGLCVCPQACGISSPEPDTDLMPSTAQGWLAFAIVAAVAVACTLYVAHQVGVVW